MASERGIVMNRKLANPVICAAMFLLGITGLTVGAEFYVAPNGSDTNAGTKDKSFATLDAARDTIRKTRSAGTLPAEGVTVWIQGGTYLRKEAFALEKKDSGTADARIVYRPCKEQEVRLVGGQYLPPSAFRKVTDPAVLERIDPAARGNVLELDLVANGIKHAGPFPEVFSDSGGIIELFFNSQRMTISRYPNKGFMTMKKVLDNAGGPSGANWETADWQKLDEKRTHGGIFEYRDPRHEKWLSAVRNGLWFRGYWRIPWQKEAVRVSQIDIVKGTVTQAKPIPGGIGSKYSRPQGDGKERYYAFNLLEELDIPGEWCIDFGKKLLYFWPPAPLTDSSVCISDMDAPVISMKDVAYVTIMGLTVEGGLGNGIEITGGKSNLIAGCKLRNMSKDAIVIKDGGDHGVVACDIYYAGENGIYLQGGDTQMLTSSGYYVLNNDIYAIGQIKTVGVAGICLGTTNNSTARVVGARIANNRIHDLPHSAITHNGNDNIIEYNDIYACSLDQSDMGLIYSNGLWTTRGNIIRYNYLHHAPGIHGVYVDDGACGTSVYGNIMQYLDSGVFISGGHDNISRNNIIIGCRRAYHLDARGIARGYNKQNKKMMDDLAYVNHSKPPFNKYPGLASILDTEPQYPRGNLFADNLVIDCNTVSDAKHTDDFKFSSDSGNVELALGDTGFSNPAGGDFSFRPDSKALRQIPGLSSLVPAKIGLYKDEYRTKIVPRTVATKQNTVSESVSDKDIAIYETKVPAASEVMELRARGGLGNFFAKLKSGKNVTIAYLGGSITKHDGWRPMTFEWFAQKYPQAKLRMASAAIGGTGSDLGVFRLRDDVLSQKPDLVFVEFAVNDGGKDPNRVANAIWAANPQTDICFVYTLGGGDTAILNAGKYQSSAAIHETIAEYYGIPSIHMGLEVAHMEKEGKLLFKMDSEKLKGMNEKNVIVFSDDNVHPRIPDGHRLYRDAVVRAMQTMESQGSPAAHALPSPLRKDNWEKAKLLQPDAATLTAGWVKLRPRDNAVASNFCKDRWPWLLRSAKPGDSLTITFKGRTAGLFDVIGPDSGGLRVFADNKELKSVVRFDPYCDSYRMHYFLLPELPDSLHTIRLEVSPEHPDKEKILLSYNNKEKARQRVEDMKKNQAKYSDAAIYVGQIMVIGDVVKVEAKNAN
jgi:hypothetical protein